MTKPHQHQLATDHPPELGRATSLGRAVRAAARPIETAAGRDARTRDAIRLRAAVTDLEGSKALVERALAFFCSRPDLLTLRQERRKARLADLLATITRAIDLERCRADANGKRLGGH